MAYAQPVLLPKLLKTLIESQTEPAGMGPQYEQKQQQNIRKPETKAQQKPSFRTKTESTLNNKRETAIAKKGGGARVRGRVDTPTQKFYN